MNKNIFRLIIIVTVGILIISISSFVVYQLYYNKSVATDKNSEETVGKSQDNSKKVPNIEYGVPETETPIPAGTVAPSPIPKVKKP
jgi:hypothetical protein